MNRLGLRHWLVVVLAAVFAHGGAFATWQLLSTPDDGGMGGAGAGIRIALAPVQADEVSAPSRAASQPAPEVEPEPKIEPEQQPGPTPAREPEPEPEPVSQQKSEPAPQPEVQEAKTAVPTAKTRPKPKTDPKHKPKPKPKPKPESIAKTSASTPAQPGTAPTTDSKAPAATDSTAPTQGEQFRAGTATGSVADTPPSYRKQLGAWLQKHKRYPRRARRLRQEGTVVLHFVMARDGTVLSWEIRRSSGHKLLDEAVAQLIRSANPLPALPANVHMQRLVLDVPIRFHLR